MTAMFLNLHNLEVRGVIRVVRKFTGWNLDLYIKKGSEMHMILEVHTWISLDVVMDIIKIQTVTLQYFFILN